MGWAAWFLAVSSASALLLVLAAWLVRFRYGFDYAFPGEIRGALTMSFLWMRRNIAASGPGPGGIPPGGSESAPSSADDVAPEATQSGQAGFLRVPEVRARTWRRLKAASLKWTLDPGTWRHLAAFLAGSGRRMLRLAGPALESLHLGAPDVLWVGRFAAVQAPLAAMVPFLDCPVEYGFNERPFALRLRVAGGCSALGIAMLLVTLIFTFPWLPLGRRFLHCWRHPRLLRWQRRLVRLV